MSAVVRIGDELYVPVVTAGAHLPLPPLPDADSGQVMQLELMSITGPPRVVAAAAEALAAHLEELIPMITKLYDHTRGG
ncbi:hypothetical protein ACQEVC_34465 [Plantactinospora sp. CA-294935]|uniref:hypothetical protein n=1 Tax=Plantactinospora sp. CA-294935 TaxID=3240012 RepID=UPI003D8E14F7